MGAANNHTRVTLLARAWSHFFSQIAFARFAGILVIVLFSYTLTLLSMTLINRLCFSAIDSITFRPSASGVNRLPPDYVYRRSDTSDNSKTMTLKWNSRWDGQQFILTSHAGASPSEQTVPLQEYQDRYTECFQDIAYGVLIEAESHNSEAGGEIVLRRYYVIRKIRNEDGSENPVMAFIVDVVSDQRLSLPNIALRLRIPDEESGNEKTVTWYPSNNIAESEYILRFVEGLRITGCYYQVYDANPVAFCTWLRNHWTDIVVKNFPHLVNCDINEATLDIAIAGKLEAILDRDWQHIRNSWPVVVQRIVNGDIQFLIVMSFFSAIVLGVSRIIVFVIGGVQCIERAKAIAERSFTRHHREALAEWSGEKWGVVHPAVCILNATSREECKAEQEQQLARVNSTRRVLLALIGGMPALGFLGTIIGISKTMMGVGNLLGEEFAKQQSRISNVAMNLAYAFDTTFLALVFAIVLGYLVEWLFMLEERQLLRAEATRRESLGAKWIENPE